MAHRRSTRKDYLVYLAVRILVCVVQAMSWSWGLNLARALAWLAYRLDRRHRLVAADNIRQAFPHLDEAAVDRMVRASYLHLTTMVIEMIRLPRVLHPHNVYDYVEHEDKERLLSWGQTGRPCLILTGHFGNWEVLSYVAGMIGLRGGIVARRLDNPYLDRFLARLRRNTGLTLLDKSADYPRILQLLQQKASLGMVGDQDAGSRGLFVNFFGRPASTFKSIALLSLEYQAPILVVSVARVAQPMCYRLYFEEAILPEEFAQRPDATLAITQRYTDALERMVRRHPEQYFWLHRRWKHQPSRKSKKAA
jgi:KDO2-lipid IV(A) lauroyltransferase